MERAKENARSRGEAEAKRLLAEAKSVADDTFRELDALRKQQKKLDAQQMNAQRAEELGISDGDTVEVSNEQHTGKVQVKVTQRINPDALYMPSHYGCSSKEEKTAYGVGLRQMDYVPFRIEPGYGGICSQEAVVTVKKVGA